MAQFRFVMRSGPTVGKTYLLEGEVIMIGRDASNEISINDAEVSRKHARILRQEDGYLLEDFGSTNGTFVNGQRLLGNIAIKAGDLVALGENVVLMYEADSDPDATMLSAKAAKSTPPPPAPVHADIPIYSGQVPAGPEPVPAAPVKMSRKTLLIVIIAILVLLCIVGVSAFLYFAPRTFWCSLPLIHWGPNMCP
jgi:predicted component of type VI protein secretion system